MSSSVANGGLAENGASNYYRISREERITGRSVSLCFRGELLSVGPFCATDTLIWFGRKIDMKLCFFHASLDVHRAGCGNTNLLILKNKAIEVGWSTPILS